MVMVASRNVTIQILIVGMDVVQPAKLNSVEIALFSLVWANSVMMVIL